MYKYSKYKVEQQEEKWKAACFYDFYVVMVIYVNQFVLVF